MKECRNAADGVYRYLPTGTGYRARPEERRESLRRIVCPLFPDSRKDAVYQGDELRKMELFPFRPVVYAMLAPGFMMDMHGVSGMAGYGRFALVNGRGETRWLDECETVETEYADGELRYTVKDRAFLTGPITVRLNATEGAAGLAGRIDPGENRVRVCLLFGGILGWNPHSPVLPPYQKDACWGNRVSVRGNTAEIALDEREGGARCPGLSRPEYDAKGDSMNCAWKILEGWKRRMRFRISRGSVRVAPPEGMIDFLPRALSDGPEAWGALACGEFSPEAKALYFAVGLGERITEGSLEELFASSVRRNREIGESLILETGDPALDGAVRIGAYPTHALYGDSVFMHGALSWRYGYLGWRSTYGPLAYGMRREVEKHFDNHFAKSVITEGVDKGAVMHMLEEAKPDARTFYNMYETFLDQAKKYWEYTGDRAFAAKLLPVVEGCIEREIRRLKPGKEWLFENSLNTWISDSHWSILGQCTQASAYMADILRLASELSEDGEKKEKYAAMAEAVRKDMFAVLWQPRKGIFGYAQDLSGNRLFHPEPEIADIYHPVEFDLSDPFQTYQMLDWVDANLRIENTANGGKLIWSSDWYPNQGRKNTHSTYILQLGEEMNLALAYQKIGLAEPGYRLLRAALMGVYGTEKDISDGNSGERPADVPMSPDVAGDFPCQLKEDGTMLGNPQFGDSVSMFGREVYEGMLGIRPRLQRGEITVAPCVPEALPKVTVRSALLDYTLRRGAETWTFGYTLKTGPCRLLLTLDLPVAGDIRAELDGVPVSFETEPWFGGVRVHLSVENAREGTFRVSFRKEETPDTEARRALRSREAFMLAYPGETIEELIDPQGIARDARIDGGRLEGVLEGAAGSAVFFLRIRAGGAAYIRPVRWTIEPETPPPEKRWRGFREEYAAPYEWKTVDIDAWFNAESPLQAMDAVVKTLRPLPAGYNQVNRDYYRVHLTSYNNLYPDWRTLDERWRGMVNEDGVVVTGEEIPFRSRASGPYMAAVTLAGAAYPDRITVHVGEAGRAAYLAVTGITFPMQSHVENLRITLIYRDGVREEHPLVNPTDIGDMWLTLWHRYHDTPANGFENMGGHHGEMSSKGLDLSGPVPTDTEAHILRFPLRSGAELSAVEMRVIANDAIFALLGITILR